MKNSSKSLRLCICTVFFILLLVLGIQKIAHSDLPADNAQNAIGNNINSRDYGNNIEDAEKEIKVKAQDGNEYHIGNPSALADFLERDNIESIEFWLEFTD